MSIFGPVAGDFDIARNTGFIARMSKYWAVRSLAVGAVSSTCDYSALLTSAKVLHWPSPICAMLGVALGATVGFLLNRTVAFKDSQGSFAGAALRYAAAISILMMIHATVVGLLTDRAKWPILAAKLLGDVTILAGGQLLLLRYIVFPRNKARAAPTITAQRAAEIV